MAHLDDLFAKPSQDYDHPKLRSWRSHQTHADTTESFIEFRRERDGLSHKPARLYFEAHKTDGTIWTNMEPWDDDLNRALVQKGFAAKDSKNEAERFGFMLESMLEPLQIRFGDGWFNAALIAYLKDNRYADAPAVAEKIKSIRENKIAPGKSYEDLAERLDQILSECASNLIKRLRYEPEQGKEILTQAMAYYLDERYSITTRKLLGW